MSERRTNSEQCVFVQLGKNLSKVTNKATDMSDSLNCECVSMKCLAQNLEKAARNILEKVVNYHHRFLQASLSIFELWL